MKELPEGKSLGWMQAPASWIGSHTVRFIGVVRVVIQDGEGFILIKKGKPLFHYFKHGTIELKGHTALDYFNSHPVIEFNLCKYTPDEFAWALKLCNIEDHDRVVPKERLFQDRFPGNTTRLPAHRFHRSQSLPGHKNPDPVVVSPPVPRLTKSGCFRTGIREHNPPSRPANPPVAKPAGTQESRPGRGFTTGSHG